MLLWRTFKSLPSGYTEQMLWDKETWNNAFYPRKKKSRFWDDDDDVVNKNHWILWGTITEINAPQTCSLFIKHWSTRCAADTLMCFFIITWSQNKNTLCYQLIKRCCDPTQETCSHVCVSSLTGSEAAGLMFHWLAVNADRSTVQSSLWWKQQRIWTTLEVKIPWTHI